MGFRESSGQGHSGRSEGRGFSGARSERSERREFHGSRSGNNFNNRGGFRSGPREMHTATCATCQKECQVPFKPTEGRPVYCNDCFKR